MRNSRSRTMAGTSAWLLLASLALAAPPAAAAVNSFTMLVPKKDPPLLQMTQMVVTAQVDTTAAIQFTITPPAGGGSPVTTTAMQPALNPPSQSFFFNQLQVTPPNISGLKDCASAATCKDPRGRNYTFTFTPTTDLDSSCHTQMAGPKTWTVTVVGGANRVLDACAVSFDENVVANECNGAFRVVPSSETFATLGGLSSQEQTCRFGVDAMLVLDRSGSMSSPARPPSPAPTRIESLRNAVQTYVTTLDAVRAAEVSSFGTAPTDQVGAVIFNHDAANLPGLAAGLNPYSPANATALVTGINTTAATGATSIGDGLISADGALSGVVADRRRVILLMSDGNQNDEQLVGADVAGRHVFTHAFGATSGPDLPHLANYQIYTVTVGNGLQVNAQINQDIALASGGFYLNSEDDAGLLPTFFGGLLQNFLETNTWQTVLSGSDKASAGAPFTVTVPITSTTQAVVVTVTPREGRSVLCLQVTPPPGSTPQDRRCNSGPLSVALTAANLGRHLGGPWGISVEPQAIEGPVTAEFSLLVLADDLGTGTRVTTSSSTYAPGDPIRVESRLSEIGKPVTGLDGTKLRVALASPKLTLGEILAASTAGTSQPPGDLMSDANAKLQNTIAANPTVLEKTPGGVTLRDDGAGGDSAAGDGIYTAEFTLEKYGHVDLVVTQEGTSPRGGAFRRQKMETLFLKAVPDGDATGVATQVVGDGSTRQLVIQFTPRNRFRDLMGPGWANYFWFVAPGQPPFKAKDNLDGTYTAQLTIGTGPVPDVDIHFMPDSVVITDDVTPDHLPSPLDESTVIVPGQPLSRLSLSLHGGFNTPVGDFGDACDGGFSLGLDLEYRFTARFAAELFYGHESFDCGGPDSSLNHFSANAKAYFGSGQWRPFLGAGAGAYDFSPGSTEFGFNVFAGLQANPSARLAVEATLRQHFVSSSGDDANFLTAHLGFRIRF